MYIWHFLKKSTEPVFDTYLTSEVKINFNIHLHTNFIKTQLS